MDLFFAAGELAGTRTVDSQRSMLSSYIQMPNNISILSQSHHIAREEGIEYRWENSQRKKGRWLGINCGLTDAMKLVSLQDLESTTSSTGLL
jgi:hypothetical protein